MKLLRGQAINFDKSGIFFSNNVSPKYRDALSNVLGIHKPFSSGKYLRLPSMVERRKREVFLFLNDKVWARIQNWRKRPLSKAGKEILVKFVGQCLLIANVSCEGNPKNVKFFVVGFEEAKC